LRNQVLSSIGCHLRREATLPKSIFIVDDSYVIRRSMRLFFEYQSGVEICGEAIDGQDALGKVHQLDPDLIIIDFAMPGMNGLETARKLRLLKPQAPIILFTNHAESICHEDAMAAGVCAVIAKDDSTALQQYIDRLLAE
jgi:DNA-binding NarL/FixJ family response regulator